ncbi:hypothetical protein PIB30_064090 [Stylosanthes scabra]|uniref:Uncharacterized protein n=1 Tax=Stylosanthes scabra TaxID=79078 RepID=A0ABU6XKK7_9FABA|nr:hypothetical protein [Stylosanthes scabra]
MPLPLVTSRCVGTVDSEARYACLNTLNPSPFPFILSSYHSNSLNSLSLLPQALALTSYSHTFAFSSSSIFALTTLHHTSLGFACEKCLVLHMAGKGKTTARTPSIRTRGSSSRQKPPVETELYETPKQAVRAPRMADVDTEEDDEF